MGRLSMRSCLAGDLAACGPCPRARQMAAEMQSALGLTTSAKLGPGEGCVGGVLRAKSRGGGAEA